MPKDVLDADDLRAVLVRAAGEIAKQEAYLNALDAAVGDGDHGITMRLGFEAIRQRLEAGDDLTTIGAVLEESGKAFLAVTGGAIGVILGRMLMSGGVALSGAHEFGSPELHAMLTAMEVSVSAGGKVHPGDKTILDAIGPARQAADPRLGLADALAKAAAAAQQGAQRTAGMRCRVGRGSRLGERTLGHCDPGAASFAVILRAFCLLTRAGGPF